MQFTHVIGQASLKAQLAHMVQQNRLSHALLFLGKEGSGGLPLALAFADYITCEKNPLQTNKKKLLGAALFADEATAVEPTTFTDACGECAACQKSAKMIHPDIHYCYPVIPKKTGDKPISTDFIADWRKFIQSSPYGNLYDWLQEIRAENKQGNITAEECGDIIHKMSLKSFESTFKILIIWMPELLGKNGNKLLKLIEEPPPDSLFILVAENEAQLLPTIVSRTQLIKLPILQPEQIQEALVRREGIEENTAWQIAGIAEGNYHEALKQSLHADDDYEVMLRDWLNCIVKKALPAQVKWIDEIAKHGREKQKQFLKYFTHLLEQAVRIRVYPSSNTNSAFEDFAKRINKICNVSQQEAIAEELDKAAYYIERNANAKMLFHALTIRLHHIITNKSLILIQ